MGSASGPERSREMVEWVRSRSRSRSKSRDEGRKSSSRRSRSKSQDRRSSRSSRRSKSGSENRNRSERRHSPNREPEQKDHVIDMNREVELPEKTEETPYFWVYIGAAIFIVALCAIGGYLIWRQKYSSEPQKENTTLVDHQTSDRFHDAVEYQQSDTAGSTYPVPVQNSFFARHWKTIVFGIAAVGGSYFLYRNIFSSDGPDQADQEADDKVGSVSTSGTSASDQGIGFTKKQVLDVMSTTGRSVAGGVSTVAGGASDLLSTAGTSVAGAWNSGKSYAGETWTVGKSAAGEAWTTGKSYAGNALTAISPTVESVWTAAKTAPTFVANNSYNCVTIGAGGLGLYGLKCAFGGLKEGQLVRARRRYANHQHAIRYGRPLRYRVVNRGTNRVVPTYTAGHHHAIQWRVKFVYDDVEQWVDVENIDFSQLRSCCEGFWEFIKPLREFIKTVCSLPMVVLGPLWGGLTFQTALWLPLYLGGLAWWKCF